MDAIIRVADPGAEVEVGVDEGTSVRVFREPSGEVVAERGDDTISLGLKDLTVSRKQDSDGDPSYVEIFEDDGQLYVRDAGTTNGVIHRDTLEETRLSEGERVPVESTATVEIGFKTDLEIERPDTTSSATGDS